MATALAGRVADAVAGLPQDAQRALHLRERDGRDYTGIARELDTSASAVADLLLAARLTLAEALRGRPAAAPVASRCAWARRGLVGLEDEEIADGGEVRRHVDGCDACEDVRRALREARLAYGSWDGRPVAVSSEGARAGHGGTGARGARRGNGGDGTAVTGAPGRPGGGAAAGRDLDGGGSERRGGAALDGGGSERPGGAALDDGGSERPGGAAAAGRPRALRGGTPTRLTFATRRVTAAVVAFLVLLLLLIVVAGGTDDGGPAPVRPVDNGQDIIPPPGESFP